MAKILLAATVLLGCVTGCSVTGTTNGGTQHVRMEVTRSPVPLRATSSWIRAACGGFRDLRHFFFVRIKFQVAFINGQSVQLAREPGGPGADDQARLCPTGT